MPSAISNNGLSEAGLLEILSSVEDVSRDVRKDQLEAKKMHTQKRMNQLDKNINLLEKQNDKLGKGGMFNFIVGMVANVVNIGMQVLSIVAPGIASVIAPIVNQFVQSLSQGLQQINPYTKEARELGVDAQKAQKNAEAQSVQVSVDESRLSANDESRKTIKNRLEQTLMDLQKSQETIFKI